MAPVFIPGKILSEQFYFQAVLPVLARDFPGLKHAAGLLDSGSEVLGYDDAVSTDHHWGPRVQLFVGEADLPLAGEVRQALAQKLPYEFMGYPTHFSQPDPHDSGVQLLQAVTRGPVNHRVTFQTIPAFVSDTLNFDLDLPLEPADWLTFPEQRLLTLTAGPVYHDEIGLEAVRAKFAYFPRDVWIYLLAAGWTRIGQEEHLMGRAGSAGDEVGSALIAARLARDCLRLWFLMERTYAPYPKWLGTAFRQLPGARELLPFLQAALAADAWQEREEPLVRVYERLAVRHNALGLTEGLPEQAARFHGRPFRVISGERFAGALLQRIEDPAVKHIAARPLIGGIDQLSDNTDFVSNPGWRLRLKKLYVE